MRDINFVPGEKKKEINQLLAESCSLVGAIVIVIGFYSVMWGKANEEKMDGGAETKSLATSNQRVPLLQNTLEEI